MPSRKDVPGRGEVTEKIETGKKEMEIKEVDLAKIVTDVETVRQTLEQLDLSGTAEGVEEVEASIRNAEDVTEGVFDREDNDLESIQAVNHEVEEGLQERRGLSESDLGKIEDANSRIETMETVNEFVRAKQAALHDIDFLSDQISRASEAREKSDEVQDRLQSRVHSKKKG